MQIRKFVDYLPTHRKIYQSFHILTTFSFKDRNRKREIFDRWSVLCTTKRRQRPSVMLQAQDLRTRDLNRALKNKEDLEIE